jgi:hypothetical protein
MVIILSVDAIARHDLGTVSGAACDRFHIGVDFFGGRARRPPAARLLKGWWGQKSEPKTVDARANTRLCPAHSKKVPAKIPGHLGF